MTTKKATTKERAAHETSPEERPDKLTHDEIDRLARGVATQLGGDEAAADLIMLLTDEIVEHCQDYLHVEAVAFRVRDRLFAESHAADRARASFVGTLRRKFVEEGGEA